MTNSDLLHRLRSIQDGAESALVVLIKDSYEITLYLHQGFLNAASSNIPDYRLGEFISRRRHMARSKLAKLVELSSRKKCLLGEVIVSQRVLDESQVKSIVQEQVIQLAIYAIAENFKVRTFTPQIRNFTIPALIDSNTLQLELARNAQTPFKMKSDTYICLANPGAISAYPWYPEELQVISELKEPRRFTDLAVASGFDFKRVLKILSVLHSLGFIAAAPRFSSDSTAIVKRSGFPFEHLTPQIPTTALNEKLKALGEAPSFVSEQFETLKVRIREAAAVKSLRVITVSSPNVEEGKSFVCANLAASCSKDAGRRSLIIDCDLRNPTLHKLIGTSLAPGLLGYLQTDLPPYCYMRRCGNLFIMTAGGVSGNPIEMLSLEKLQKLIAHFRTEFDTVLLDSPPLAPTSDVQILTSLSDGLILVVRSGKTSYRSLKRTNRNVDDQKLLGIVLNDIKPMLFNTQYDARFYGHQSESLFPFAPANPGMPRKTYLE